MHFTLAQIEQIVIDKTGKAVGSCTPVILNATELANKQKTDNWNGDVFFGTLLLTTEALISFGCDGCDDTLTISPDTVVNTPKVYDNLMFDKINAGETLRLSSTTEAMFSGFKFTLTTNE